MLPHTAVDSAMVIGLGRAKSRRDRTKLSLASSFHLRTKNSRLKGRSFLDLADQFPRAMGLAPPRPNGAPLVLRTKAGPTGARSESEV
jgi:hypothetical protein